MMQTKLALLCELDHQLLKALEEKEINAEEIVSLVDKREQLLQSTLHFLGENPEFKQSKQWHEAIVRTKHLVELMQSETNRVGQILQKYRHGSKSLQQYKKFL